MKIQILGVGFDDLTADEAVQAGRALLEQPGFHYAVTPNPEFLLDAEKDPEFQSTLNSADLVLADGIGVIHAARILGTPLKGRVTGIDFAREMLGVLQETGGRLYLLGAKPGVAEEAGRRILAPYPGVTLCGTHDGYFDEGHAAAMAHLVRDARADLLFVCLGAPKQEKWMARFGPETGCRLAIGLGGALDVFAGNVQRAPEGWQKLGMEWAYRLIHQPSRFSRMARLPLILIKAAGARLRGGKGRAA